MLTILQGSCSGRKLHAKLSHQLFRYSSFIWIQKVQPLANEKTDFAEAVSAALAEEATGTYETIEAATYYRIGAQI